MAKKLSSNKIIISILIAALVCLVVSVVCGFRYTYMTNDDYMISLMTANGDNKCIFVNYFLTSFFVILQKIFVGVNCFAVSEMAVCLVSLIVINYVFLSKQENYVGIIFCFLIDTFVYCTSIIMIQYTQTTSICCAAGVLLLLNSFLSETRKKYKILQRVFGFLLVIFGSMYRIESFYLICVFSAALLLCVIACKISSLHKKGESWLYSIKKSVFANFKMIISLLLAAVISFGCFALSELIKRSDSDYVAHLELGRGRQYVTDYNVVPFDENKDFYQSIGIDTEEDLLLTTQGYIDKDYISAEKMIAIGEYSEKTILGNRSKIGYVVTNNLHSVKRAVKKVYGTALLIKNVLSLPLSNKLFVGMILIFAVFAIFLFVLILRKYKSKHVDFSTSLFISKLLLVLIWVAYFKVYSVNIKNVLLLILCAFALFSLFGGGKKQTVFSALFSFLAMAVYCYQIWFRLNFRACFTFAFPAIVFLAYLYEKPNFAKKENDCPVIYKAKLSVYALLIVAVTVATLLPQKMISKELYIPQTAKYDSNVSDYFDEHKDTEFVHVISANSVVDKAYYNVFGIPQLKNNTILYGSWCISSDYYDNLLKSKGIDSLFEQMINNKKTTLVLQLEKDLDIVSVYEKYLNSHYALPDQHISLLQEAVFDSKATLAAGGETTKTIGIYSIAAN